MRKALLALCCLLSVVFVANGESPQNPRTTSVGTQRSERIQSDSVNRAAAPRRAGTLGARTAIAPTQQSRSAGVSRSASIKNTRFLPVTAARSASVSRSAAAPRATAVFSDTSKLGTGYNTCRESYNTCMDQFCAGANDTYRRCICSNKYKDFADMEAALSSAKTMLQSFADNNLKNVGLTADEVGAMGTATSGELATTTDSSAAAAMLEEIGDLLSGKAKPAQQPTTLDFSNLNFDAAMNDVWAGTDALNSSTKDLTSLTGEDLYNEVNTQCTQLSASSCESQATAQMVRSAYNLLISQDCQAYSKGIDAQKEQVAQKVRDANKLLRDARLDEYRSHNSASMNECITKVRNDILNDAACGANFKRCLDFTGMYIDSNTGEPIYSPNLFQLASQIKLENTNASENKTFLAGLESFKNRATASLDSCRDDATAVWDAFKSQALIEIAQAQDKKLQEVKDSCVMTMKDCYDSTTEALNSFDDTTSQRTTALSAQASAAMCKDKVLACAALYTPAGGVACKFDTNNKITNADKCGLRELMSFVSTVDSVKVAEGCDSSLETYVAETCAPAAGDTINQSPYGCRLISPSTFMRGLQSYAKTFCMGADDAVLDTDTLNSVNNAMETVKEQITAQLQQQCTELGGRWVSDVSELSKTTKSELDSNFLTAVYGSLNNFKQTADSSYDWVSVTSTLTGTARSALVPRAGEVVAQQTQAISNISDLSISQTQAQKQSATDKNVSTNKTVSADKTAATRTVQTIALPNSIGWGVCLYWGAAAKCNAQNTALGGIGLASWDGSQCVYTAGFPQAVCETIGNATWLEDQKECWIAR